MFSFELPHLIFTTAVHELWQLVRSANGPRTRSIEIDYMTPIGLNNDAHKSVIHPHNNESEESEL